MLIFITSSLLFDVATYLCLLHERGNKVPSVVYVQISFYMDRCMVSFTISKVYYFVMLSCILYCVSISIYSKELSVICNR